MDLLQGKKETELLISKPPCWNYSKQTLLRAQSTQVLSIGQSPQGCASWDVGTQIPSALPESRSSGGAVAPPAQPSFMP